MDHLRRESLLEVVNRIQNENIQPETSDDGQSPDSAEIPIDYSMSRKRRILDNYDEQSPLEKSVKKTLDYGSDGHSEDRSCSGSPSQNNLLSSSPEMDSPVQIIRHHPNLPNIPIFPSVLHPEIHGQQQQQQHPHHHATALQLFLQVQQRKHQQAELFHNMTAANSIHNMQPSVRWSDTPSPPVTPSQGSVSSMITPKPESLPMSPPSSGGPQSQEKDSAYWERRRKNNEAAKRSRDARRQKEQQIAIRAQLLEQENIHLKFELAQLRAENSQMRQQIYLLHGSKE